MADFMTKLRGAATCGVVGGSDIVKIAEQLGGMDGEWSKKILDSE